MKLRFTRRAVQDLSGIAHYIRERDPAAANRVRAAILDSLKILTAFPRIGRVQSVTGVRKLLVRKYAYLIYYTVYDASDEVVVLAIRHPARKRDLGDT